MELKKVVGRGVSVLLGLLVLVLITGERPTEIRSGHPQTPGFLWQSDVALAADRAPATPGSALLASLDVPPIPPNTELGPFEVRIESKTVPFEARGVTLGISIGNGVDVSSFNIPLEVKTVSGGAFWKNVYAQLDTLPWTGRLRNVLTEGRIFDKTGVDGVSPDIVTLSTSQGGGPCLASGSVEEMIILRFDATEDSGSFVIDTTSSSPSGGLNMISCSKDFSVVPSFTPGVVYVIGAPDPSFEYSDLLGYTFHPSTPTVALEDFDGDENLDIAINGRIYPALPGIPGNNAVYVYFGSADGSITQVDSLVVGQDLYPRSTYAAFINQDNYPDIVVFKDYAPYDVTVFLSNGDRTFSAPIVTPLHESLFGRGNAVGYINEDAFADFLRGNGLYLGDGNGHFTFGGVPFGPTPYLEVIPEEINLFDMNLDGYQDAVLIDFVGDLLIYWGNRYGIFRLAEQQYNAIPSAAQIESSYGDAIIDLDGDRNADFAVAIPDDVRYPYKDTTSVIYLFFSDGRFQITEIAEVAISGCCRSVEALDFNKDGHLDLAIGCLDRIRILIGNGSREFHHRYSIVGPGLLSAVTDFSRDGDWDFITSSGMLLSTGSPGVSILDSQMVSAGVNNVLLRVTNPVDQKVEELGNFIPGARIAKRDIDLNGVVDQQISDLNLQAGNYEIDVWRDPSAPSGSNYTLAIGINGHKARVLARNASVPAPGDTLQFDFPIGAGFEVSPPTGGYATTTRPTLDWGGIAGIKRNTTLYSFELDDQMDFTSLEYSVATLSEPHVTVPVFLQPDSLYYWRYRSFDGVSWSAYSPVYAVNTPACDCPNQSDINGDGLIDVSDLVGLMAILFSGVSDSQTASCPMTRADFDGNGFVDSMDMNGMIDYLFAGGPPTSDPCASH